MPGFEHHPKKWIVGESLPNAVYSLTRYFQDFTGSWFDRLAGGSPPNQLTPADLLAVSMLSVTVPARATVWILHEGADEIEGLLAQVPTDVDIWDDGGAIADDGPLCALWTRLQQPSAQWEGGEDANGIGAVIASKLLARKRPRLVPMFDPVVVDALGVYETGHYWQSWKDAFGDPELLPAVEAARAEAAQTYPDIAALSALRVMDIVIWHMNR